MLNMKSCIFFPCPLVRGKLQGKHSLCAKVFARQLECTLIEFWRVLCEDLTVILLVKKYLSANQGKVLLSLMDVAQNLIFFTSYYIYSRLLILFSK